MTPPGSGPALICRDFAPRAACERIIAGMDGGVATPSEIVTDHVRVDDGVRRSFDVEVDAAVLEFVCGLLAPAAAIVAEAFAQPGMRFEGPGCLRYQRGGFYLPHRDVMPAASADAWPRLISVVLFLNGGGGALAGGELRLHASAGKIDIAPECGTLVAFPAATVHEVLPVRAGVRYTVVDWLA